MLRLLLGRSKTGKSTALLRAITENGPHRPQILIVPEQYSHETERRLCTVGGNRTAGYCEVLSFTRLSNRVLTVAGGIAVPVLDGGGRLLLMHEAVTQTVSSLSVYRKSSKRAAFLQNLLATADELKSYCVSPVQLLTAGDGQGGESGGRLHDLGLILTAYDQLVSCRAADPRDRLTRLREKLPESGYARGKDFYLDCFTDFTPQEKGVLSALMRDGHDVTVALTCDGLMEDTPVFDAARRTARELIALARELHTGVTFDTLQGRSDGCPPELAHMEQHLFTGEAEPFQESCQAIHLCRAERPYDEVEQAAGTIRTLVQSGRYRYRDIAVVARTMEGYDSLIETVFARYEIPVFLGKQENILEKPILTLLTAALDAVDGYEYDAMFRYLKTGLAGVDAEDVDLLENYVLQWDIRGRKWSQAEAWGWNPAGYAMPWTDGDRAEVARLDRLRRGIIAPLERLRKTPDAGGPSLVRVLYAFLEEIQLPQRLEERAKRLTERGELRQAEEYRQLWDILVGAMEQCAALMGDSVLGLAQFAGLFQLMLSQYSVATIPVSLDRVSAGDILRTAHKEAKVVFLLGADDGHFPLVGQTAGLLTQEDRTLLASYGCTLTPSPEQRLDRELTLAYDAVCLPSEQLYISWPAAGEDAQHCAEFVERLQALFPTLTVREQDETLKCTAPLPALDWAAGHTGSGVLEELGALSEWESRVERLRAAAVVARGHLSREMVDRLYGKEVRISASKIDNIRSCHFGYFMEYGLKAKARRAAGFDAPQVGTFIHYVLEALLKEAKPLGGVKNLEQAQIKALTDRAVRQYIEKELGGLDSQEPRFQYLFRRLLESIDLIVSNLTDELKRSSFRPLAFELGFGSVKDLPPVRLEVDGMTLVISGFVDRVDGWEKDGKLYLRVVDYKSGRKVFDLTEVWHGLQMQMLLYLFTLQDEGKAYFGADELVPAGILYTQVHEVLIGGKRGMTPETIQKETDRALRRSGLLLDDADVLDAMEHLEPGEAPRFLPLRVSAKTGAISGDSLASAAQWGLLHSHIQDVLGKIAGELAAGNINADPYLHAGRSACDWCDYAPACQFEEGHGGDCRRYLYRVRGQQFWEAAAEKHGKEEER